MTHLCGAPIVMGTLVEAPAAEKKPLPTWSNSSPRRRRRRRPSGADESGGLPRHASLWVDRDLRARDRERMAFGMGRLPAAEQAAKKARQGVRYLVLEALDVKNPETMATVPRDGETMGEVIFRGNVVMRGYLKNRAATNEAFKGGLVSFRRLGRQAQRTTNPNEGPFERHHHFGRREHLVDQSGRCADEAPGHQPPPSSASLTRNGATQWLHRAQAGREATPEEIIAL